MDKQKFGLKEEKKRHKEGSKLSERGTILMAKKQIRGNPNPNLGKK